MSWGIEITGTKDAVKANVVEQLDRIAGSYKGQPEADDVNACKERVLALIDAMAFGKDASGYETNAVFVTAGGSHGTTTGGLTNASFNVSVQRVSLAL